MTHHHRHSRDGFAPPYRDHHANQQPARSRGSRSSSRAHSAPLNAAGYPDSWSPATAPSVHQRWLDDQAVFRRLEDEGRGSSQTLAPMARSVRPPPGGSRDLRLLGVAGALGLILAASSWWLLAPSAPAAVASATPSPVVAKRAPETNSSERDQAVAIPLMQASPRVAAQPLVAEARFVAQTKPTSAPPSAESTPTLGVAEPARAAVIHAVTPHGAAPAQLPVAPVAEEAADEFSERDPEPEAEAPATASINVDAARAAMSAAAGRAAGCGSRGGPSGRGKVAVTVAPSGSVKSVSVGAPFGGTSVGNCVAAAFRGVSVPPFAGDAINLTKSFEIAAPKEAAPEEAPKSDEADAPQPERQPPKRPKRVKRGLRKHRVNLD